MEVPVMALIRYSKPEQDIFGKRFSDIMDEFFNDAVANRQSGFAPSINISESEKQFMIDVEIPGMDKKDINVNLENSRLTVSGERSFENEEKNGTKFHRVERHYGSFSRSFQLPESVDEKTINATYKNGVLNITLDKSKEKVKKQIDIK